eukprot:CAMPEP_0172672740 /NCGR_PEP_ID=MMETSP1074-20121228/11732_1 /TAXON_ID=2916 /ORGANISM="Ceratium fusus, Strain PA161109" /LENGTH=142 /DNA_ID=CAMNT_0013489969 /DNA_START=16 /DNA_END=444 /DNA_ORIENTATION=-
MTPHRASPLLVTAVFAALALAPVAFVGIPLRTSISSSRMGEVGHTSVVPRVPLQARGGDSEGSISEGLNPLALILGFFAAVVVAILAFAINFGFFTCWDTAMFEAKKIPQCLVVSTAFGLDYLNIYTAPPNADPALFKGGSS